MTNIYVISMEVDLSCANLFTQTAVYLQKDETTWWHDKKRDTMQILKMISVIPFGPMWLLVLITYLWNCYCYLKPILDVTLWYM